MHSETKCPCKRTRTHTPVHPGSPPHAPPTACACRLRSSAARKQHVQCPPLLCRACRASGARPD
eukprot:1005614-Prymnesium_polylepis.1